MAKGKHTQRRDTREEKDTKSFRPKEFKVLTQKQAEYKASIYGCSYTLATGRAGTGKTYVPCRLAARMLNNNQIEKIVLCRPAVSQSSSLGFWKGTKEEKMMEWIRPMMGALNDDFPTSYVEYMVKVGKIEFVPLETIKGHSFNNAFVIIDEAEDINVKELKSIMTRLGRDSKMVICGDISQIDLREESGLSRAVDMRERYENFRNRVGHIHFDEKEDIVRSEEVADIIFDFEADEELELNGDL